MVMVHIIITLIRSFKRSKGKLPKNIHIDSDLLNNIKAEIPYYVNSAMYSEKENTLAGLNIILIKEYGLWLS